MALQLFYFLTLAGIICCQEVIKMRVKEDEDVILPCSLDSTNIRAETFDWKKDDQNVFQYSSGSHPNNGRGGQDPQFKGRVFHFEDQLQSGDASIKISKAKKTDSGNYSCIFPFKQPRIRSTIELIVGSCPKPSVTILDDTKDWALLQCEVQIQDGFPKPKVEWLDSGNKTVPVTNTTKGKYNIILKATVTKSDVYRCVSTQEKICHQIDQRIKVSLPGSAVTKMRVNEDEDVILPCSLDSTNIRTETFVWKKDDQTNVFLYSSGNHYHNGRGGQDPQFKGRVFHFEDQLQSGNASIEIRKTKMTDSGSYSCIFPYHQPEIRSTILLIVDCILKDRTEEKIAGSSPKPYVTIRDQTKDWALLQCKVQGVFPKPKVQWLDSENNRVPAEEPQETESEGKYNIILKATVTKSDVYRCVSTQEGICHQIDQRTKVYVHGACTGWIVGLVVAVAVAVVGFVLYFRQRKRKQIYKDILSAVTDAFDEARATNKDEPLSL